MSHPRSRRKRSAYRQLTPVLCALAAAAAAFALEPSLAVDGTLLDLEIAARALISGPGPARQSPVAVVALDRASLDAPELARYPRVFFEPGWVGALSAVMDAGARVAAFDEIFAYDPATFPGIGHDFDLPFLAALHKNRDRVVLARSAASLPAKPFAFSAGFDSLGLVEIPEDPDGRYRHVPALIDSSSGPQPTLSALALRRAGFRMPPEVLLASRRHLESIPTYSLIDVVRCAQRDPDTLRAAFNGKIVLFGGTLAEEDQRQTSGRFLRRPVNDSAAAVCGLKQIAASISTSGTVPGVFLHAGAVEAVATGDLTATAPIPAVAGIAALAAGVGALAGLLLAPWTTVLAVGATAIALCASAIWALQHDYWTPIALPLIALAGSPGVAYSVRYLVEDRARRHVQHAFGRYLAPSIVERLAHDPSALTLGGERREVTVMFADLSGFSAMSGRLEPEPLTAAVNRYLGYIVEEVEKTNGYVDKFIGDAVMAIWGAPVVDRDHALNSVRAAIAASERTRRSQIEDEQRGSEGFAVKIGINSGPAVVGNVGTAKRFNYTAVGETVNLASRLERVPAIYRCGIVIGQRTAELVKGEFLTRELDWILLKDAKEPMAIYEPIVAHADASPEQIARADRFAEALECYRAKRYKEAASIWDELAAGECEFEPSGNGSTGAREDSPPAVMAHRARGLATHPPVEAWDGVYVLNLK